MNANTTEPRWEGSVRRLTHGDPCQSSMDEDEIAFASALGLDIASLRQDSMEVKHIVLNICHAINGVSDVSSVAKLRDFPLSVRYLQRASSIVIFDVIP
jgi:hypothetical protein